MRMSKSGTSAADVVMKTDAHDLTQILWEYGEEKASRRIARAIVTARETTPITSTAQLAKIIHSVMPSKKPGQIDPATRSFQALRIYVNRELEEVAIGLAAVESLLKPDGILAVVSFHSLEDRIVKRFLTTRSQHAARPSRHLPIAVGAAPALTLLRAKRYCQARKNAESIVVRVQPSCASPAHQRPCQYVSQSGGCCMRIIIMTAAVLASLGTTLYQIKTGIDERQAQLRHLQANIATTQRDIALLEAEWAFLSRPDQVMIYLPACWI